MTMPKRIQLKRTKGWKMPPNTVKVDRTTRWGNPYVVGESYPVTEDECCKTVLHQTGPMTREQAVRAYAEEGHRLGIFDGIEALRGKNLACWCKPGDPCHADVLLELSNPSEKEG